MAFELPTVTKVLCTNANARRELHGDEHVRAIDLAMQISGENTLLDKFEPGLREHHFCNRALKAGQESLPDVVIPLPNLRFPHLETKHRYGGKDKLRGYRFVLDYGLGGDSSLDFADAVVTNRWYEINEGGSVTLGWTVQYNGDELTDDATYGRLAALATVGECHVQIIAPPVLTLVKGKGYRSGKPDTPAGADDGGDQLDLEEGGDGDDTPETPEAAFTRSAAGN